MTNLRISSIVVSGYTNEGHPLVELSGEWIGSGIPPRLVRNFYKDEEDNLLQDVYFLTETTMSQNLIPMYTLAGRYPSTIQQGARTCVVSYKYGVTTDATPVEIVSDYIFGSDPDEYTTWNLISRNKGTEV